MTGPEVHADGEIWVAINFELRKALAAKYNGQFPESDAALQKQCALGQVPVTQCPGNRRWIQLAFDSFLLMQTAPSMVDARNAILAADQARFGGADQAEIWAAFARRGLGRFASQTNGSGRTAGVESDTNPLPDFEAPGQANANVTFAATSTETGNPAVKARIYVGHYEARVSPIADTDPATNAPSTASANNLDEKATFAPGTYEFIATAPGYGAVRFRKTFKANNNPTITLRFAPNFASTTQGARPRATPRRSPTPRAPWCSPAPTVLKNLIDDSEATDWQAAATQGADGAWNVDGTAGDDRPRGLAPADDPPRPGQRADRAGLRPHHARATCRRTASRRCASSRSGRATTRPPTARRTTATSAPTPAQSDAFPADAPRPVAPMLLLRNFTFSPVKATHLRIVVRNSQCTGGPAYQGEQDADPNNATDCNAAGPASTRFVRVAEVQAFGANSSAQG